MTGPHAADRPDGPRLREHPTARRRHGLRGLVLLVTSVVAVASVVVATRSTADASAPVPHRPLGSGPVYSGDFPDPSVLLVGDRYFAYATQSGPFHLQVISSPDLLHWSAPREALPVLPVWARSGYTWAPAAAAAPGGGYELFYAARDRALGLQCLGRAVSPTPDGPFVDPSATPFLCQSALGGSIDPYVLDLGTARYLVWKSDGANGAPQQIWSARLGSADSATVGTPVLLLSATATWEGGVVEGPALVATAGGLYLFFSGNRWSTSRYSIGVAGCDSPLGPCAAGNPPEALSTASGLGGPGGPTFFEDRSGRELMAFAAWSGTPDTSTGARELYVTGVDTSGPFPTLVRLLHPAG